MPLLTRVKPKIYQDSVRLMRLSEQLSALDQVNQAFTAMGTDANKRVLKESGLLSGTIQEAGANDLMIVIDAASDDAATHALTVAEQFLGQADHAATPGDTAEAAPKTLQQARRKLPNANLMLISVPGSFAAFEAANALKAGMHVFLFSDNVSLEDERILKQVAVAQGLLMMGPGCGTAIVNGVALGFANVLKRGPVGVVGASGTGLQELTSLVDRGGVGISQAIGVGGRDLSETIGGTMMLHAIAMLIADPDTTLLVLISKPPAPAVAQKILAAARAGGKPVIANFLGSQRTGTENGVSFTATIAATAEAVLRAVTGNHRTPYALDPAAVEQLVQSERHRLKPGQRYLRGLFSGGSLCDEAMHILQESVGDVYSNIPLTPEFALDDAWHSKAHSCIDMGEEEFTNGRPHPMIDPRLRQERLLREAEDPDVAVILLDVVIGYGSHDDPAGALCTTLKAARTKAAAAGRYLAVVAHVCGTRQDPQGLEQQEQKLREIGAIVLPTNAQAATVAAALVQPANGKQ
ncbi:MAG: acyl-CoA synthetase FdrA [Herpetosiphon sp.]